MDDLLTALAADARAEHLQAYRRYLLERDGELDLPRRALAKREAQMARFEHVEPRHTLDGALFAAQYAQFEQARPTSDEMLLLLTLCKINAAEAYGVESTFELAERRAREHADDDSELRVLIEEHYHTRILRSAACEYGLAITGSYRPPLTLRGLIGGIASAPLQLSRPLLLASELVGTLVFAQTFVKAGEVLAGKPELRDRVQERIAEIVIDELGHVTYNRLLLGGWGMFQARRLLPMVAIGVSQLCQELSALGLGVTTDQRWLQRLPEDVTRRAFLVRAPRAAQAFAA